MNSKETMNPVFDMDEGIAGARFRVVRGDKYKFHGKAPWNSQFQCGINVLYLCTMGKKNLYMHINHWS